MYRRAVLTSTVLLALLGAGEAPAPIDHSALDAFLKAHVKPGGLVDYLSVRRPDELAKLDAYLAEMAKVDDEKLSPDERLALYCNLYNAVMIRAVATRYRVGFRPSENAFRIFKEDLVRLNGKVVSLDHLEHTLMRKVHFADEPRLHAGIVCAAMSCPELIPEGYTGARVREQLEDRMRRWVNDPRLSPADPATKAVSVSRLFVTYGADFGPDRPAVEAYVRRYLRDEVKDYRIEFQTFYDWTPNIAPPPPPPSAERYVWVTTVAADLFADRGKPRTTVTGLGAIHRVVGEEGEWLRIENPNFNGPELWIRGSETKAYR